MAFSSELLQLFISLFINSTTLLWFSLTSLAFASTAGLVLAVHKSIPITKIPDEITRISSNPKFFKLNFMID